MSSTMTLPDFRVCEQARASRDPRFDGLFFIAVTSTGIYCRPTCPVRSPKRENIRYYPTAAAAEAAGFRPCLRCRPELSPSEPWPRGDATVARALKLIEEGFLADNPLAALAERVGVGERQLRRLFMERLGATPIDVHGTRRLLFAKQLLTETSLSILDVALESGFNSVRRFNACFREAYGLTPSAVRRKPRRARAHGQVLELRLDYRPPYDFTTLLDFLRADALAGLEDVRTGTYARVFGPVEAPGWFRVSAWSKSANALRLELHCPSPTRILEIVTRLRRMLDLDADPQVINAALAEDPELGPLVQARPGLRLPGGWDGFEVAVRSVLAHATGAGDGDRAGRETGDQRRAGRGAGGERAGREAGGDQAGRGGGRDRAGRDDGRAALRVLQHYGPPVDLPADFPASRLFPPPEALVDADLTSIGVDQEAAATVRAIARAVLDGRVDFGADRTLEGFVQRWSALPGIARGVAHGIALRALGHPDAFPVDGKLPGLGRAGDTTGPAPQGLVESAERWRPWRAYAFVHVRRHLSAERRLQRRAPRSGHVRDQRGGNANLG